MLMRSIVPSPKGALSSSQVLQVTNIYLENASKINDHDIVLLLCHNAEAVLSQSKSTAKNPFSVNGEDQAMRQVIGSAYFNLGKLLEVHGHQDEARAFYKRSNKWGGPVLDSGPPTKTSKRSDIVGSIKGAPTLTAAISTLNPSLPSVSQLKHRSDIATLPLHIFARNARPPTIPFNPPEPDTRLNDTPQLACCLGLLRDVINPDDILDPATRNWLQLTAADTDEQERLKALATDVIRAFKRDELKDAKAVAEVAYLAPVLEKDDFRYLVKEFHSGIEQSALLDIHQLEGLAQLLQGADPGYLEADDLVKLLELLNTRLIDTHHQSPHLVFRLTLTASRVLDAMADTDVKDLDREKLHEPLSKYLDALKASSDSYLVYQAAYAYQALLYVPDNETLWQAAMRRAGKVIKGVSGLVSAVKGLDLNGFMEGLKDIQQGLAGAADVTRLVKATYNGVTSLNKSGQIFMDCLKEGLSFSRKCSWYPALRGADALIRDGQLAKLRKLICEAPCRRDPAFQWGICQRLGDIASNPMWDIEARRSAVAFLGEIYRNDSTWGHQPTVKQWVLNILMQLSSSHLDEMQFAETLLQELGVNGDADKQALYRACQEDELGFLPLNTPFPALGIPSLLDRVQNRLDVEGTLRLLRRQRFKERGNTVYIPPQAKASLQASDSARFPLMETVKEFVAGDRQVFLLLGDSGAGKSTFNREFEYELWKTYKKKTGAIPLHINLPSIDKPEHDMIAKQLRKAEFTEPQIRELKLHRKFILVCDGYDESQQTHNLYTSNRFNQPGEWNAKIVISCRSEYLGVDYRDRFQPVDRNRRAEGALFQEAVVTPFATHQVQDYINQYVALHQPLWGAKEYLEALDRIPSLKELVKNPFLMSLSLEVLPRMVDAGQDGSINGSTSITRVALYDQFIEHWLERGKKRLGEKNLSPQARAAFESLIDEGFTRTGIDYLKDLCVAIYKEQDGQPIVRYSRKKDEGTWKEEFFGRDDEKQLLREACPLTRSGNQHRFIHRSLLEYGLSLAVSDPQDLKETAMPVSRLTRRRSVDSDLSIDMDDVLDADVAKEKPEPDRNSPLVWRLFVNDLSVIQFLEERVQQDHSLLQLLLDYVELSKTNKKWRKAAANAITILVRVGVQFNHADLKGIQIPRADLSYGSFELADLQGADLRNVNLRGTWMLQADLSKSQMAGVQFGELPFLEQESRIECCNYSPDGSLFAVGLSNGQINVYSTSSWEIQSTLWKHSRGITAMSFSPNGSHIVSGSKDNKVRVWDIEKGECRHVLTHHGKSVTCIAFSPTDDMVASGSNDCTIRLYDTKTGNSTSTLSGHESFVVSIAFSSDGKQLASSSHDWTAKLWDIESGNCTHTLSGHTDVVGSVMYSPRGDQIASTSDDKTLRLWDSRTGQCLHILGDTDQLASTSEDCTARSWSWGTHRSRVSANHARMFSTFAYSPQGDQLASSCLSKTVKLWDVQTGVCSHILADHTSTIFSVAYSPRGDQLASSSFDKTVKLWDPETGACLQTLSGHESSVTIVMYPPKGDYVASCSDDRTVRLWVARAGTSRDVSNDHSDRVNCVQFSPYQGQAASCSADKTIRVWDVERGKCFRTLTGHGDTVRWIDYSTSGNQIASASDDGTTRLWDINTGKCLKILTGHTAIVYRAVFSPKTNQIVSCSRDTTVRLWDAESGACTHILIGHVETVWSAVYSPNGEQVASASYDRTARLWDAFSGEPLHVLAGHTDSVNAATYSPKGDQLATAGADRTVRLWDTQTGSCLHILAGHEYQVWRISYSPLGSQLASASKDRTVRLWNVETGTCTNVLTDHADEVYRAVYSPCGKMMASSGADDSLRLWDVASGQCRVAIQDFRERVICVDWSAVTATDATATANYLIAGFHDGSVKIWQVMNNFEMRVCRTGWKGELSVKDASVQGVRGLSQLSKQLLHQRGARGEPVPRLREAVTKIIRIASVVAKLKSLAGKQEASSTITGDIVEPFEQSFEQSFEQPVE